MRLFLFAIALVVAILGCSDGKLNLLLVFWGEHEEESSGSREKPSSSSIVVVVPSSSSVYAPPPSSSSEEELPSSSSEEISSSSEEIPSSSSRGPRSSSAKTDSNGNTYETYPTLEVGGEGVMNVKTTRYWDACKPMCSRLEHIGNPNPWAIARTCDRGGRNEIPLFFVRDSNQWGKWLGTTPCAKDAGTYDAQNWLNSQTYKDWRRDHPNFPEGSLGYTCFDKIPYAVDDTLAYAFAASSKAACGKCYRLQFNSEWSYDKRADGESKSRATHLVLAHKTLIVMVDNTGAKDSTFDLMIPGGGQGDYQCLQEQIGSYHEGNSYGGLLWECTFAEGDRYGKPSDRWTETEWQDCLREKCIREFGSSSGKPKELLEGCLWHVDWFMAADNPEAYAVETPCPKHLIDKYNSTVNTKLPDCYVDGTCKIDGIPDYGL